MAKEITPPLAIQDSLSDKEDEAPEAFAPVTNRERIVSIDTLRGVALLGILLINIVVFGLPENAFSVPTIAGGHTGLNLAFWYANQIFGQISGVFKLAYNCAVHRFTESHEKLSLPASPLIASARSGLRVGNAPR
jgi:uncharacterized protein